MKWLAMLALAAASACAADSTATRSGGRFAVQAGDRSLFDGPARASYCAADSTLAVLFVAGGWSGSVAVRTWWPLDSASTFEVGTLDTLGGAAFGFREIADSIGPALLGTGGTLELRPGAALDATITASAVRGAARPDTVQVSGILRAIPVDSDACPAGP